MSPFPVLPCDTRHQSLVHSLHLSTHLRQACRVPSPTYQRIADDLRRSIVNGTLPPGGRLPSRHELARQYGVSDRVGMEAVRLLVAEGFVEARSGSGSYVRQRPEMQRMTRSWFTKRRGGSPFRAAMDAAGQTGTWESASERVPM